MTPEKLPRGQIEVDKSPKRWITEDEFDLDRSDRIFVKIAAFLLIVIPVAIIVLKAVLR